jgi:hypothetical protein
MSLNPDYLLVLEKLVKTSGTGNVMEMLSYDSSHFEEGFTVANDMQNLDLVKLLYSNFNKNLVVVELTLLGEQKGNG